MIDRLGGLLARCGPHVPWLAGHLRANFRAAGLADPRLLGGHFEQLGAHFAGALHALRCAGRGADGARQLAALAEARVTLDDSLARLREERQAGRGVIVVGPHITNYLLNLTRLNQFVPLTVYLRHSKDARRRTAKERWYRASGVSWISEPAERGGALGRIGRMAGALTAGAVLFITPDLPQKCGAGTPVHVLGRRVELPGGAALLALRSGAPLFMLTARSDGGRQHLLLSGPYASRDDGGRSVRKLAVQRRMQWFANQFSNFLRTSPALWYLWGDKRWTRVWRGDPRYCAGATNAPAQGEALAEGL
jgi:lauroyl/myristoyl acyltransferase